MSTLSKQVMRRVYFIWGVRQLASPFFVKSVLFVALAWQVKEAVFVREVFANMSRIEASELFNFFSAAFINTGLIVQTALLGSGILAVLLARDFLASRAENLVFAKSV